MNKKNLKGEIEIIKKGQAQGLPLQYAHDKHLNSEIDTTLPFSCVKCYLFRFSNLLRLDKVTNEARVIYLISIIGWLLRRLSLCICQLKSPTIGVSEIDYESSACFNKSRPTIKGNASVLQFLIGLVCVVHLEGDMVDTDVLLPTNLVNFKNWLIRAG